MPDRELNIITTPCIHEFETESSQYAYNFFESSEFVRNGDIFVINSEQIVGILVEAWPTALTTNHGDFGILPDTANNFSMPFWQSYPSVFDNKSYDYTRSIAIAERIIHERNWSRP